MSEAVSARTLVVIPCLNEEAHLPALLARLLDDQGAEAFRIVVADGGSTDRSREIVDAVALRDPRVVLMDNPRRLQAAGVNRAAAVHGGDCAWLLRVDAHAEYPADYGSSLLDEAARTGADAVVVSMVTRGGGFFQRAAAAAQNSLLGAGGSPHRKPGPGRWVDHGHHALMRLDLFRAVGGYDEDFVANEDAELDLRLAAHGARIWLSGEVSIGYVPRPSPGRLFRQYLNYGDGRARTLLRHRQRPKVRQLLPAMVTPAVLAAPLGFLFEPLAWPAAAWAAASLAYGAVLGLRARDGAAAASGAAAMVMHLGWSLGFWRRLLSTRPGRRERRMLAPLEPG
jgi:succinoglycan biosynthesis protein ExoA